MGRKGLILCLFAAVTLAMFLGGINPALGANAQIVSLSATDTGVDAYVRPGDNVMVFADYSVSDGNNKVTGLGVRFHYNSSKLNFMGFLSSFATNRVSIEDQPQNDTAVNYDGDPNTDKYVMIAWADQNGNWPGEPLPLELAILNFTVNATAAGDTFVNVSFSGTAEGVGQRYTGVSESTCIHISGVKNQIVSLLPSSSSLMGGESLAVLAWYDVNDKDDTLMGLGVRFHYNSNLLDLTSFASMVPNDQVSIETQPKDDAANYDSDSTTDKYVMVAWADEESKWPSQALQLNIAKLNFTAKNAQGIANVNVSFSDTATGQGYAGVASNAVVNVYSNPVQIVSLTPASSETKVGNAVILTASYDVNSGDNTLTGVGVRFHFDDTKLTFTGFSNVFDNEFGSSKVAEDATPRQDTANFDADATTNKFVSIAWADVNGNWPGENIALPLMLAKLSFTAKAEGTAYIKVSFSDTATGLGYTGMAKNAVVNIVTDIITPTYFVITTSAGAGGTITPVNWQAQTGESVAFEIKPNAGCQIAKLVDNGVDKTDQTANNRYVVYDVQSDHKIEVSFNCECDAVAAFTVITDLLTASFNTTDSKGNLWFDYGDGSTGNAVTHEYADGGTYTVVLTATGANDCKVETQKEITVRDPNCDAFATFNFVINGLNVTFDTTGSNGDLWFNYGDGTAGKSLTHTYSGGGKYNVSLKATGTGVCTYLAQKKVDVSTPGCTAIAMFNATTKNLEATFDTAGSNGALVFDYGDGTTGTAKTHTYAVGGTYAVTLTATADNGCSSRIQKLVTVRAAGCDAVSTFTAKIDGMNVEFNTAGSFGTLFFNYGDGETGAAAAHTYKAGGTYIVTLTATGTGGCKYQAKREVIVTGCDAVAIFTVKTDGMTATFDTAGSTGTLVFDFGDNVTEAVTAGQTIKHTYANEGTYSVTLTATGTGGCTFQTKKNVTVKICEAVARFTATMNMMTVTLDPTGSVGALMFDYGDGNSGQALTYTYLVEGTYTITLTATGAEGCTVVSQQEVTATEISDICAKAAFTFETAGRTVTFNTSGSKGELAFDYGDSITETVTAGAVVSHAYTADGTYTVKLTATGDDGCTDSSQHEITVVCAIARFIYSTNGLTATFDTTDSSGALTFDYGDGITETVTAGAVIEHTYTSAGTYTVKLTTTGSDGCMVQMQQEVTVNVTACDAVATFTGNTDGLTVTFDTSGSNGTLLFDYGDGNSGADMTHTYASGGTYTVTLTATTSPTCTDQMTKQIIVTGAGVCNARAVFTAISTNLTAMFNTTGSVGTLTFNYGDGQTGTALSHTYTAAGTYTVILTAAGSDGVNPCTVEARQSVTITTAGCNAAAVFTASADGLTATFNTAGSVGTLSFSYGDGQTGTAASHTYSATGTYTVVLTARISDTCIARTERQVTVVSACDALASFTATVSGRTATFDTNGSKGTLMFNYGDGYTGSSTRHTYATAGTFTVTLTATGVGGCVNTASRSITTQILPPTLYSPADDSTNQLLMLTLRVNTEGSGDQIRWQISTNPNFSGLVLDERSYSSTLTVPDFFLNANSTVYYWRAMTTVQNAASEWSEAYAFTTVYRTQEDQNGNGIPDIQEPSDPMFNYPSVLTVVGDGQIAVSVSTGFTLVMLKSIDPETMPVPGGADMPLGLIGFKLAGGAPGGTGTITVYFSEPASSDAVWYVYNRSEGRFEIDTDAQFSEDRMSVTFRIVDGSEWDADGIANGIIIVPAAGFSAAGGTCIAVFTASTDGLTVTINATGSSGTLSFDYGDGTTDSEMMTHTYAQAGTYTITMTATGTDGCEVFFRQTVTVSEEDEGDSNDNCFISTVASNSLRSSVVIMILAAVAGILTMRRARR